MIRICTTSVIFLAAWSTLNRRQLRAEEITIKVKADEVIGHVSRHLAGACIEDVNHEIYGGLYSQMVFGESFQEPAPTVAPLGFAAYGGNWIAGDDTGELAAAAGAGPKLLADSPATFESGEVRVELRFADKAAGNAGL